MNKSSKCETNVTTTESKTAEASSSKGNKCKIRGKKRKRKDSEESLDEDDTLPENTLEVEKNVHAVALKNNLDDESVKKILKKVVTNDHVLALVKIREEEESSKVEEKGVQPKLTRAKMKELMKASPKSAPWNLELTPIKEIPVKTRPEVKALIAQELPEDEDDEEYEPTHDEVPSDDDQTLESCSDLDSQPRTPATPKASSSPRVVRDGPFKVPQNITPARKKLIMDEEEATIALRTRSKLSLSETPIEHIESSFVPPDDVPTPVVDDHLWSEFLSDCLNPGSVANEDDDEADPEYNVAADPDANDEEDETLEGSILKISRKELNDLVTELFNVMPEAADDALVEDLTNNMLSEHVDVPRTNAHWDGKQEPLSDGENVTEVQNSQNTGVTTRRDSTARFSIGKSEPEDMEYECHSIIEIEPEQISAKEAPKKSRDKVINTQPQPVTMSVEEQNLSVQPADSVKDGPPSILRELTSDTNRVDICIDQTVKMLPDQILILQQQLRQHVQLAVSNFLQLYVNPTHWNMAPAYKKYLEQLNKISEDNPKSVVDVCNLKPGLELVRTWESTMAESTPENKAMVEFIRKEDEICRRKFYANSKYIGKFPEQFCSVLANSSVFLYPYLLPIAPYRADCSRRFSYTMSEDRLIVLGLDQFWQYLDSNPELYPPPKRVNPRQRWGLSMTCALVCKHMFPWLSPRYLLSHIHKVRKEKDNPVFKFFTKREIEPVKHKLLPFNPNLTLYEQPEHEMPRVWVRYLSKSSKRFRDFIYKRKYSGLPPEGVELQIGQTNETPSKAPLPIDFTKEIISTRINVKPKVPKPPKKPDKFDIIIPSTDKNKEILVIHTDAKGNKTLKACLAPSEIDANNPPNVLSNNNEPVLNQNPSDFDTQSNKDDSDKSNNSEPRTAKPRFQQIPVLLGNKMQVLNVSVNNHAPELENANHTLEDDSEPNRSQVTVRALDNNIEKDTERANSSVSDKENSNEKRDLSSDSTAKTESSKPLLKACLLAPVDSLKGKSFNKKSKSHLGNVFKVVEKNDGIYLMPSPSSMKKSAKKTKASNLQSESTDKDSPENEISGDHCKCCLLLKTISKERQSLITEFLKPKTEKHCECTYRKYPRISKRLKLLISNFDNKYKRLFMALKSKVEATSPLRNAEELDSVDLDDVVAVTSFHLKLTNRLNILKDITAKRKIYAMFSKFDVNSDDPLDLTIKVYKALEVEAVDLYKEFLGFLTAEQADRIGAFKDFFVQYCVESLLRFVEREVINETNRLLILMEIQNLFSNSRNSSCDMCHNLLKCMKDYPKLARYAFSLFPHRAGMRERRKESCREDNPPPSSPEPNNSNLLVERPTVTEASTVTPQEEMDFEDQDHSECGLTICEEELPREDYDADETNCENEETSINRNSATPPPEPPNATQDCTSQIIVKVFKSETRTSDTEADEFETKTIDSDYTEATKEEVLSDQIDIKTETIEWTRDEDKLILEALMEYLNAQSDKSKPVLQVIEERNVYKRLSEKLTEKSIDDIRDRVAYLLLQVLVVSES